MTLSFLYSAIVKRLMCFLNAVLALDVGQLAVSEVLMGHSISH